MRTFSFDNRSSKITSPRQVFAKSSPSPPRQARSVHVVVPFPSRHCRRLLIAPNSLRACRAGWSAGVRLVARPRWPRCRTDAPPLCCRQRRKATRRRTEQPPATPRHPGSRSSCGKGTACWTPASAPFSGFGNNVANPTWDELGTDLLRVSSVASAEASPRPNNQPEPIFSGLRHDSTESRSRFG